MTYSKRDIKHDLFGNQWSYYDLKGFETVKMYHNSNHDTRSLMKAPDGTLFLYDFHEQMGFPDDSIYEHFFFVESEEQAEQFQRADMYTLKSNFRKYIYVGPGWDIKAVG